MRERIKVLEGKVVLNTPDLAAATAEEASEVPLPGDGSSMYNNDEY